MDWGESSIIYDGDAYSLVPIFCGTENGKGFDELIHTSGYGRLAATGRGCLFILSEDIVHAGEKVAEVVVAHFGVLNFIERGMSEVLVVELTDER